jgi:glycosyltransferase involved in cell wall biosynthesis
MPRETTQVSVIMPAYNAAQSIERALQSVATQTLPAAEVIVVDDGSNDGTAARAMAMQSILEPSKLIVVEQLNQGAGAARNKAIHAATQPYLAFLDADDEWLPTKLERSMAVMNEADYVLVAHDYLDMTPKGDDHIDCAQRFNEGADPYISLYLKGFIPSISVVVRRKTVIAAGGFDATLKNAQDFELWLKILAEPGTSFKVFGEPLARYYHTSDGIMSHTERRIICCVKIAHRYLPAIRARHRNAYAILSRRLINLYSEAFAVYMRSRKFIRAAAIPFRLTAAIIMSGLNPDDELHRKDAMPFIAFSVWLVAVLGFYLTQFKSLVNPLIDVVSRAIGIK